ncbi:helix-turn-helix protein [mine drainage metagenome]|uniref:Helix-turn-helix protein n=1 Tax=mine drainage metagenome TaxID=410659 RepID=A0A1J5SLK9_9ZZZZ
MANVASVLKEEIIRLARKELRSETEKLKKASAQYRSEIAALKRQSAALEQQVSRLEKSATKNIEVKSSPEEATKARFTSKGFKTLRKRLGLTAEVIAALLGVSAQTIYNWEAGNSSPRAQQMVRIVMLRGMGKREVEAILQDMGI